MMGFFYGSYFIHKGNPSFRQGLPEHRNVKAWFCRAIPIVIFPSVSVRRQWHRDSQAGRACCSVRNVLPVQNERCKLDLSGFKNLEGLHYAW